MSLTSFNIQLWRFDALEPFHRISNLPQPAPAATANLIVFYKYPYPSNSSIRTNISCKSNSWNRRSPQNQSILRVWGRIGYYWGMRRCETSYDTRNLISFKQALPWRIVFLCTNLTGILFSFCCRMYCIPVAWRSISLNEIIHKLASSFYCAKFR